VVQAGQYANANYRLGAKRTHGDNVLMSGRSFPSSWVVPRKLMISVPA